MVSRSDHYLFSEPRCSLLCSLFLLSDFQGLLHLSLRINQYPYHKFFLIFLILSLPVSKLPAMCSFIYFCIHYPGACGSAFCFMALQGSEQFFDILLNWYCLLFHMYFVSSAVYDFQFQVSYYCIKEPTRQLRVKCNYSSNVELVGKRYRTEKLRFEWCPN